MKPIRWTLAGGILFCLFWTASAMGAMKQKEDKPLADVPVAGSWYAGIGTGAGIPLSDWNVDYYLAGGVGLFIGYRLDSIWAVQLGADRWFFTGGGSSTYDLRILPELRWNAPGDGLSPYALAGFGYDLQFNNPSGYNTAAPAAVFGLGAQYDLRQGKHLFLEIRTHLFFYQDATPIDMPIALGLSEDL